MGDNITKNPWLGLETYKEGEVLYGRRNEIRELFRYVVNYNCTLFYGKSGIGKSSILNAGIIPDVRKRGYLPIPIRLSHKNENSYLQQIDIAIRETLTSIEEVIPCKEKGNESIYEYFHRHKFYSENGERVKLLIIFDQFEEIFTMQEDEQKKKAFFTQFANQLNDILPNDLDCKVEISSDIKDKIKIVDSDKFENIFDAIDFGTNSVLPEYVDDNIVHFVFTIREDFLSEFEYYTDVIPSLKQNRYGLRPINENQAAEIIMQPAPGVVDEKVAKLIIEKITEKSDFSLNGTPKLEVDSAVLSLYLNRLYEAKEKRGDRSITDKLVEQKSGEIISDFYSEAISGISPATIELLEDKLLNGQGRRLNISEYGAVYEFKIPKTDLDVLCEKRKILRKFKYNGNTHIEYIHDILCPVVKERKDKRALLLAEKRKREEVERKAKRIVSYMVFLILIITVLLVIVFTLKENSEIRVLHNSLKAEYEKSQRINKELEVLNEENKRQNTEILALNSSLQEEYEKSLKANEELKAQIKKNQEQRDIIDSRDKLIKTYLKEFSLNLNFEVGTSKVVMDSETISRIEELLKEINSIGANLKSIEVITTCSPEGNPKANNILAKARANAFITIIRPHIGDKIPVESIAEQSTWQNVADILRRQGNDLLANKIEELSKKHNGNQNAIYYELRKTANEYEQIKSVFPLLRTTTCRLIIAH